MKKYLRILFIVMAVLLSACQPSQQNHIHKKVSGEKMIKVSVNNKTFKLLLNDSTAAREFRDSLPLTLKMSDVNGNEKYAVLDRDFTSNNHRAGKIRSGDLKLWAGNGLVLFYDDFSSSYSYTDLGKLVDSSGFTDSLGHGNVTVTFEEEN
ncbi:MAG: lipoprotein [Streptococcus sp.]|nr:lipoprotein [Streptococcus sp.]